MQLRANLLILSFISFTACEKHNPADFQKKLVGEWKVIGSKGINPNLLVYPISDGGLFVYDDLSGRWRSYSAWLSNSRDTLLGRQGCVRQYALRLSYLSEQDRLVVDDTILLQHSRMIPRQPIQ